MLFSNQNSFSDISILSFALANLFCFGLCLIPLIMCNRYMNYSHFLIFFIFAQYISKTLKHRNQTFALFRNSYHSKPSLFHQTLLSYFCHQTDLHIFYFSQNLPFPFMLHFCIGIRFQILCMDAVFLTMLPIHNHLLSFPLPHNLYYVVKKVSRKVRRGENEKICMTKQAYNFSKKEYRSALLCKFLQKCSFLCKKIDIDSLFWYN